MSALKGTDSGPLGYCWRTSISIVTNRPNAPHRAVKDEDLYGTTGETGAFMYEGIRKPIGELY